MNWTLAQAAIIRAFWSAVFPLIGAGVAWLSNPGNLESVGVTNMTIAVVLGAVFYGIKKAVFPDTKF